MHNKNIGLVNTYQNGRLTSSLICYNKSILYHISSLLSNIFLTFSFITYFKYCQRTFYFRLWTFCYKCYWNFGFRQLWKHVYWFFVFWEILLIQYKTKVIETSKQYACDGSKYMKVYVWKNKATYKIAFSWSWIIFAFV